MIQKSDSSRSGGGTIAALTVARHGESVANVAFATAEATGRVDAGVTCGDAEVELSTLGIRQAAALGHALADWPPEHQPEIVVCSPYLRARQTLKIASEVAAAAGVELPCPRFDERLRDRVMGELELMTPMTVAARFPAEAIRRQVDELEYRPPGGESFGDVAARVAEFLDELHRCHTGRRVFLVAHDAVVLVLRHLVEGLSFAELHAMLRTGPVANASLTRWRATDCGLVLAEYNAIGHLESIKRLP